MRETQMMTNESYLKPHRLHPVWILFSIGHLIKDFIIPIVLILVVNAKSDSLIMTAGRYGVAILLVYRIISILFEWWNFSYSLSEDELKIKEGRFVRQKRFIPLERIQGVQQDSPFLHRVFRLTSLTIDTAASAEDSSVKLKCISQSEAERIQEYLAGEKHEQSEDEDAGVREEDEQKLLKKEHYSITRKEIIFASLTSLSFVAFLPVLSGIYSNIDDFFSIWNTAEQVLTFLEQTWLFLVITIFILLVISILFGITITYLRYGNFTVSADENRLYIHKGVLSHSEWMIAKQRIQGISMKQSFIRRWFGIVRADLICAGANGDEKIESNTLFPFIAEKRAIQLLPELLQDFIIKNEMNPLPKIALWIKLIRPSCFWIIGTAALLYFWPDKWYILIGLFVLITVHRILEYVNSAYLLDSTFIQLRTGSFSSDFFITKKSKIEQVIVTESWLQRKTGLAAVKIITRGTPMHEAEIRDLPKKESVRIYLWYANRNS
ncbi:PH domain-containing protein [Metabacillus idriensis]|uniref:PH domain-containing protein n=1 Tax=Metabacillus idriensis TaxID=324768 RepID=UPI001748A4AA|nr:PH domain-containing protein [Metabacillus idriensis]